MGFRRVSGTFDGESGTSDSSFGGTGSSSEKTSFITRFRWTSMLCWSWTMTKSRHISLTYSEGGLSPTEGVWSDKYLEEKGQLVQFRPRDAVMSPGFLFIVLRPKICDREKMDDREIIKYNRVNIIE